MYTTKTYKEVSRRNILERITPIQIFEFYISGYEREDKPFCSEIRKDKKPSCSIITRPGGDALYTDFGTSEYFDCFKYIQAKFGVTFYETLNIINNDFKLGLNGKNPVKASPLLIGHYEKAKTERHRRNTTIQIKTRNWNAGVDKIYWSQYQISCEILNEYNVIPISHLWLNGTLIKVPNNKPSYAYYLGKGKYKILSPYSDDGHKWVSNVDKSYFQGYDQLPWVGETLIITKSLKDVMVLASFGIPAIAPQNENTEITVEFMGGLRKRFKNIVIFYDNDEAGITGSNKLVNEHSLPSIKVPLDSGEKDISDYSKAYGKENTSLLLDGLLQNY